MLDNLKKYQIILASNSPRRKELMSGLGVDYVVRTLPDVDESYPDTLVGAEIPERARSISMAPSLPSGFPSTFPSIQTMVSAVINNSPGCIMVR